MHVLQSMCRFQPAIKNDVVKLLGTILGYFALADKARSTPWTANGFRATPHSTDVASAVAKPTSAKLRNQSAAKLRLRFC